jgi:hypothetical protein
VGVLLALCELLVLYDRHDHESGHDRDRDDGHIQLLYPFASLVSKCGPADLI